jgi:hypothetical protein
MPKRRSVVTHKSDEVQGEGSFVVTTAVKVKEIREIRKHAADPDFDDFEGGIGLLAAHIVKWNWVDDEGKPLPSPNEDPKVIDELTNEESEYLVGLLMGEKGSSKNSPTK